MTLFVLDKEQNSNEPSNNQNAPVDIVSAAIMAKVLKEREKERLTRKHCQTCTCSVTSFDSKSCQTNDLSPLAPVSSSSRVFYTNRISHI